MEIYLDNAATTKPAKEVTEKMLQVSQDIYGNPSSKHKMGFEAEKILRNTSEILADILKIQEKEIIYTSSATEANNTAIFGTANLKSRYGKHIITTAMEHASVREPFLELERRGFRVTFLQPDKDGMVSIEKLKESLCKDTILVSIMHVNNETGVIQPLEEMGELIKDFNSDIYFHVDAVQSFGKFKISPKKFNADMLSVSAHKFHGPKGVGFLYLKKEVNISPLMYGGGQQYGLRSGTENVPGIAGLGEAARLIYNSDFETNTKEMTQLRQYFEENLKKLPDSFINSENADKRAPHIISAVIKGIRSEVLLHALEEKGIYVSSGSACSSNKPGLSFALSAMGLSKEDLGSVIRFSLCHDTTKEDTDKCIQALNELVPVLRQFVRK